MRPLPCTSWDLGFSVLTSGSPLPTFPRTEFPALILPSGKAGGSVSHDWESALSLGAALS